MKWAGILQGPGEIMEIMEGWLKVREYYQEKGGAPGRVSQEERREQSEAASAGGWG